MKKSFAVIGTGAIGGYYGGRLANGGNEVHFLLHSDYEHVQAYGLRVDSSDGDFRLKSVNAYRNAADMPPCDVVIVSLKTTRNHLLADLLPPVMKPGGVALVLQNGLGVEDEVAGIVGHENVMGGLCFICSSKTGPGHISHVDYGHVNLGDYAKGGKPAGITGRLKDMAEIFEAAGIRARINDDLIQARWKKLVWNIPFNGLSVIFNAATDKIMKDPDSRSLVEDTMREVAVGAAMCGYPIEDGFVEEMLRDTDNMAAYTPSMLLDYRKKIPMEVNAIYRKPMNAADQAGFKMTLTSSLCRQLMYLNRKNSHGG